MKDNQFNCVIYLRYEKIQDCNPQPIGNLYQLSTSLKIFDSR